jgi:uncharacterized membrane protein YjdF
MILKKGQALILIINIVMIVGFTFFYFGRKNYEFLMYIGVIIAILGLIIVTNKRHNLSNFVLWGLTLWGFFHMAGGSFTYQGAIWYKQTLVELWRHSEFVILRYDQFVHLMGFGISTFIAYELLTPYLNKKTNWKVLSIMLVIIGLGIGALNEIVEFFAVLFFPETGVGGYYNTSWDLVFNTIGAIIAVIIINLKRLKKI